MDWQKLQDELPGFFKELMGIPVDWADQPRSVYTTNARAELDIQHPESLGVDDSNWFDIEQDSVQQTISGAREIVIQIVVMAMSQRLPLAARVYLEKLRNRLRLQSSIDRMADFGLAFVSVDSFVEMDPTEESRVVSKSSLEIRFAYVEEETDTAIPYVETARVYSDELKDAGGDGLPASEQVDVIGPEV